MEKIHKKMFLISFSDIDKKKFKETVEKINSVSKMFTIVIMDKIEEIEMVDYFLLNSKEEWSILYYYCVLFCKPILNEIWLKDSYENKEWISYENDINKKYLNMNRKINYVTLINSNIDVSKNIVVVT